MKVELLVNGSPVAEFDGSDENLLRFQAVTYHYLAEAQNESKKIATGFSRAKFSKLNELQFGNSKTAPTDLR